MRYRYLGKRKETEKQNDAVVKKSPGNCPKTITRVTITSVTLRYCRKEVYFSLGFSMMVLS